MFNIYDLKLYSKCVNHSCEPDTFICRVVQCAMLVVKKTKRKYNASYNTKWKPRDSTKPFVFLSGRIYPDILIL